MNNASARIPQAMTCYQSLSLRGFSLIELMIAIVVMGVLMAIAVPSYQHYIKKTHREVVQADLVSFAERMEKAATVRFTFTGLAANGNTGTPVASVFAAQAPIVGDTKLYNLTIAAAGNNSYTVQATPIAGTIMAGDGRMTLTNRGERCWFEGQDSTGGTCDIW